MNELRNVTKQDIVSELWRRGDLSYLRHTGQEEYLKFAEQSQYIKNMLHCGRGWGKTWLLLSMVIEYAIKNPNSRIVYATQTRESARQIVVPTFKMLTLGVPDIVKPQWKSQGHSVDFNNGSTIVVEGADDDHGNKLRGAYAHIVICDELGFWSHADYVVNHILLPQCQRVNGRMYLTSTTPESLGHEFYGFVLECKKNDTYYRKTIYDNPRLTEAEVVKYAEQCGGINTTMFRREYLCEDVVETDKAVVPEFNEDIHVMTDKEAKDIPEFRNVYVSSDFGLKDYTHILFGYYDFAKAQVIIEDEICANYVRTSEIAQKIKDKETELWFDPKTSANIKPNIRVSDATPQQIYDLVTDHGIEFVKAFNHDFDASLNNMRNMFNSRKIKINAKCKNLLHQLKVGIWNKNRTDYERLPGAGHLDGVDALIYMCKHIDYNKNPIPPGYGLSRTTHMDIGRQKTTHALNKVINWSKQ